jgi:hypothetical protein
VNISFQLDITKTKFPIRFKRRHSWRNSKIRFDVSGFPNYERFWLFGHDICVQWGSKLKRMDEPRRSEDVQDAG